MTVRIVLLGINQRNAPVEIREEVNLSGAHAMAVLPELSERSGAREAFVLSTCNRTEFYFAHDDDAPIASLREALRTQWPNTRAFEQGYLHCVPHEAKAVSHLFRVASGIESQVLGDTQIVAQIKQAHRIADQAGTLGPILDRARTASLRASKRARTETAIGKGASSVGGAVLRSVRQAFTNLERTRVLVIGGGSAGRDIARHLSKTGLARLAFATRNPSQAAALAREFQGDQVGWNDVAHEMATTHVLITATTARLDLLSKESVQQFASSRSDQMLIVDAGVPRNVDPAVVELPFVQLLNLDSLAREHEHALAARRQEIPKVEAILDEELIRWQRWRAHATVNQCPNLRNQPHCAVAVGASIG